MASAFDELLGNLVNKLKDIGVGSKTAAQKRAEIDYLTPSNISAQSGQATMRDYPYYYGRGDDPATSYSADIPSRKFYDPFGTRVSGYGSETGGGYSRGGLFKDSITPEREEELRRMQEKRLPGEEADLRGINLNPDYDNPFFILPERNSSAVADGTVLAGAGRTGELSAFDTDYANQTAGNPLKIFEPLFSATQGYQDRMTDSERRRKADIEAGTSKRTGLFTTTEEEAAAYKRKKALDELMQYGGSDMTYQGQAADNAARDAILEYGGGEMRYQGQGENTIDIDPIVLEIPEQPTNEEVIRTLEQDYADLAAAGADTATLSALAREIDSYRDRQSSLPSLVSEAAASDVVELNGAKVVGNQWSPTPPTTFSSVKGYAGKEAIEQVEATYGPLNDLQKFLVEKEGYYPGWYKDTVGVATVGVGQTGKYAAMTPIEAMNAKIKEVKVKVPVFKDLSLIEQKALIDAHYRGDINNGWKNKYVTYIKARTNDPKSNTLNSLKQKSYDELWNNESYIKMMGRLQANKSKDGDKGVMTRVRKWMKDLFQDDQAPAAIQARIDKYAKTL